MTPQEAAEQYANEASENLQKTFLTLGYEPETEAEREYWKSAFKAGYAKANNIHDQALSSALKEIAELHAKLHEMSEYITKVQSNNDDLEFANSELHVWKKEMLQLWNKLDAYLQTRNDIRLGESKIDFAIKIMKDRDELHARVKELENESDEWKSKYYGDQTIRFGNTDEGEIYPRPVMTSKNTHGFTSKSTRQPDSTDLPPDVTT